MIIFNIFKGVVYGAIFWFLVEARPPILRPQPGLAQTTGRTRWTASYLIMTTMSSGKFCFAIDRGGTFTDVWARCPNGETRVMKLLSEDPANYPDAPREGIRRILEQVRWDGRRGRGHLRP